MADDVNHKVRSEALSDMASMLQDEADKAKARMDQMNATLQGMTVTANLTAAKALRLRQELEQKMEKSEEVTPQEDARLQELESLHAEMRAGMQAQANECLLQVGRAQQAQRSADMALQYSKLEEARAEGEDPAQRRLGLEIVDTGAA